MRTPLAILFVGCGNMGAAIIRGALKSIPAVKIVGLDVDLERAKSLLPEDHRLELYPSADGLSGVRFDLIVLAIKPQSLGSLPPDIIAIMQDAPVASILAGINLERLSNVIGVTAVVRVMPNLPALVGQGMSLGCADVALTPQTRDLIEVLFGGVGCFDWVNDECLFEQANPVFGCGPGFVFSFAEQMTNAAIARGVPETLARKLVVQTFLGASTMLATDARDAAALKEAVSSPEGTTLAGLAVLEAPSGLPELVPAMIEAAHARAMKLAAADQQLN